MSLPNFAILIFYGLVMLKDLLKDYYEENRPWGPKIEAFFEFWGSPYEHPFEHLVFILILVLSIFVILEFMHLSLDDNGKYKDRSGHLVILYLNEQVANFKFFMVLYLIYVLWFNSSYILNEFNFMIFFWF